MKNPVLQRATLIKLVVGAAVAVGIAYLFGLQNYGNVVLIKQAAANMAALRSYHVDLEAIVNNDQRFVRGDFDVANNRSRVTMSLSPGATLVVSADNTTYFSSDEGKTFIETADKKYYLQGLYEAQSLLQFSHMWNSSNINKLWNIREADPASELIDGVLTRHFTANVKDAPGIDVSGWGSMEGTVDIWVTTGDNPTVRQIKASSTEPPSFTVATIKWNYLNHALDIQAPPTSALLVPTAVPTISIGATDSPNLALLKKAVINMRAADSYRVIVTTSLPPSRQVVLNNGEPHKSEATATEVISESEVFDYRQGDGQDDPRGAAMWSIGLASVSNDALKDASPTFELIDGTSTKHIVTTVRELKELAWIYADKPDSVIELWLSTDANPTVRQMMVTAMGDKGTETITFKWSYFNDLYPPPEPTP